MPQPLLSRHALGRVLRGLLTAELGLARGRQRGHAADPASQEPAGAWADAMPLGTGGLGCDSLELMTLAAAANEMFHLHETGAEADLLSSPSFGAWLDAVEAAWRGGVARVTFSTSGSTGRPKRCAQGADRLRTEAAALAARWSDRRRIVALAPAHHIYGFLFTAMLSDRLGVPCLEVEASALPRLVPELRAGDLIVSFPERWAYLARSVPAWRPGVEGVVSTAPCAPGILRDLVDRGLDRISEVYGSSETAGIAWRDAPDAPYDLMPHWSFVEAGHGAESGIDHGGAPALRHADGSVHTLMDRVERTSDREFRLAGRRDGMVQVGGVNVLPAAVAERLRGRPGVLWAGVRLMRPEQGTRLKAFLVPEPGIDGDALRLDVEAWAAAHLSTAERPVSVTVGDGAVPELPGKAFDW